MADQWTTIDSAFPSSNGYADRIVVVPSTYWGNRNDSSTWEGRQLKASIIAIKAEECQTQLHSLSQSRSEWTSRKEKTERADKTLNKAEGAVGVSGCQCTTMKINIKVNVREK